MLTTTFRRRSAVLLLAVCTFTLASCSSAEPQPPAADPAAGGSREATPPSPESAVSLDECRRLFDQKKFDDALAVADRALAGGPKSTEALLLRADIKLAMGRRPAALEDAVRAVESLQSSSTDDVSCSAYRTRASCLEANEKVKAALVDLGRAKQLATDPAVRKQIEAEYSRVDAITVTCFGCRGTGESPCAWCKGTGADTCRGCTGRGTITQVSNIGNIRLITCPTCRGSGSEACFQCQGSGGRCLLCSGRGRTKPLQ